MKLEGDARAQLCPVCLLRLSFESEPIDPTNSHPDHDERISLVELAVSTPELPDRQYAHFRIELKEDGTPFELGRGAMGVTYKATDTNLHRLVALKVISPQYVGDESTRQRFVREARAAASLRHENIASVFHLGSTGPGYFYAMELVEGQTLEQIIDSRGPLSQEAALEITCQVAAALTAAHQHHLVHRDIKPGNLMVSFKTDDRPSVKVIDFGLVKITDISAGNSLGSTPGTFFGTLRYGSPEQIRQGRADVRSDIYSLGVTLWEMLVGKVPFDGTPGEIADQHLHAPLPLSKVQHLSHPVVSLLGNMLEKDPTRRPQTPEELLAILRAVGKVSAAYPGVIAISKRTHRPFPHRLFAFRMLIVGGIALLATLVGLFFLVPKFAPPAVDAKSVAVLPFENLSDSKENGYFSDGLTSEVIFQLSKVSELRVISRDSVLHYKDVPADRHKSLTVIGSELNVRCILDSSVQRVENRVKIVAVLYEARTGQRLWGASYDREIKELFAIQSDLAEQIAASLHATLSNTERKRIEQAPTENLAAYELYLRGQALLELNQEHTNEMAVELFKQALEKDPKFVLAYASLADAYVDRVSRFNHETFWLDSAVDLCRQAILLDPSQVRGYTELARTYFWKGWEDRMPDLVAKALQLAPNDERANALALQNSMINRRFDQAYLLGLKCYSLNPKDPYVPYQMAMLCAMVEEKDLSERWMERAIGLMSNPQQRKMMECERLVTRRAYSEALAGLRQLPYDLVTYGDSVSELIYDLLVRVEDWDGLMAQVKSDIPRYPSDGGLVQYFALALRNSGKEAEAMANAQRALKMEEETPPTPGSPRWKHWALACDYRFLNRNKEAYEHLKAFFSSGDLVDLPLMRDQPWFSLFKKDPEFQHIWADMNRRHQAARDRIRQIESKA